MYREQQHNITVHVTNIWYREHLIHGTFNDKVEAFPDLFRKKGILCYFMKNNTHK